MTEHTPGLVRWNTEEYVTDMNGWMDGYGEGGGKQDGKNVVLMRNEFYHYNYHISSSIMPLK